MQKFNFNLWKQGRRVFTRDGRLVSPLYHLDTPGLLYPLVGVVEGSDYVESWQIDGSFGIPTVITQDDSKMDLMVEYPDEMTARSRVAFNAGYWLNHAANMLAGAEHMMPGQLRKLHHKAKWTFEYVLDNCVYREIEHAEVDAAYEKAHGILTLTDEC